MVYHQEKEVSRFPDWLTWQALISPKLEVREATCKQIHDQTYKIRLVVENTGWFPSYVTKKALEKKTVRGVIAEIEIPEDASLETGLERVEGVQLEGRAYQAAFPRSPENTLDRQKFEWVVKAPSGGEVSLVARHDRAGLVRVTVNLE